MGQFSFILPDGLSPHGRQYLSRACLAGGYDHTPVPTRVRFDGKRVQLTRDLCESSYLLVPWPAGPMGCPATLSATLRERPEPYHLVTELARGKLNQVRVQAAEWEGVGLTVSAADRGDLAAAVAAFGRAVLFPDDPSAPADAAAALTAAHAVGDRLTRQFADLLMASRTADGAKPETHLGARLYRTPDAAAGAAYAAAFNAVRVVPDWRVIEPVVADYRWEEMDGLVDWAVGAGLGVSVGPLIDLTHGPFPDWLGESDGDLPTLAAFMCDFVETAIARYRDRVPTWAVFAGFNHADALGLIEDDRIRLAARLLEAARSAAPAAELLGGLSLAWGDYLVGEDLTYSPLVFADTLLRNGLPLGGLELELLCGDGPRASQPRTLLDSYRLLDQFAVLGVPLHLALATPTSPPAGPDAGSCPPGWATQTAFLGTSVTQVKSITWDTWADGDPARVPATALWAGGLPVGGQLDALAELTRTHLR